MIGGRINLNASHVYLLGIGGVGMSALAKYFLNKGAKVCGYDRARSELTNSIEELGGIVHFDDQVDDLPTWLKKKSDLEREDILLVYTPAIPNTHPGLVWLKEQGYGLHKRAAVLGEISQHYPTVAVAGTHGKTSSCAVAAHLLTCAKIPFYGFLGGVATNYGTNFFAPEAGVEPSLCLVEADEFDRSFLALSPRFAAITSVDADHLDIYGDVDTMIESYGQFVNCISETCFIHEDISGDQVDKLNTDRQFEQYGLETDLAQKNDDYSFQLDPIRWPLWANTTFQLGIPGWHNVSNTLGVLHILKSYLTSFSAQNLKDALRSFTGVTRRFEIKIQTETRLYVDDYAHHPSEIEATISTLKQLRPGKRLLAIFQPHLFTRTRDLAHEFALALNLADEVWLLPIYPARELPIEGIDSNLILSFLDDKKGRILSKEEVLMELEIVHYPMIVTLGAGDIDKLAKPITDLLSNHGA